MKKVIVLLMVTGFIYGQSFDYIGVKKCSMCHKKEAKGAQLKQWQGSAHANAFETLKNEESAKIAKEMDLKVPAYEAAECLICHSTGFGNGGYEVKDAEFWAQKTEKGKPTKDVILMSNLQAVGCESCHGPGSKFKSTKTMKAIFTDVVEGKTVGLWEPNEQVCIACHNKKSPTYKEFKFAERIGEYTHPMPAEMRKELLEKYITK